MEFWNYILACWNFMDSSFTIWNYTFTWKELFTIPLYVVLIIGLVNILLHGFTHFGGN